MQRVLLTCSEITHTAPGLSTPGSLKSSGAAGTCPKAQGRGILTQSCRNVSREHSQGWVLCSPVTAITWFDRQSELSSKSSGYLLQSYLQPILG